jgi:hypothetical protein
LDPSITHTFTQGDWEVAAATGGVADEEECFDESIAGGREGAIGIADVLRRVT